MTKTTIWTRPLLATALAALLATAGGARAQGASQASSALSLLPVAVVVAAPSAVLAGGALLTVVAVQASAEGTVWVLERVSDGARLSLQMAGGAVLASGAVVTVAALSSGWVLSQAGRVICFIPNEIGQALLHNERVTR
ncbi:hypothetical protein [Aquabacterium sp. OR-4]|uniref:hypothetical protein n=1 Tax=Aquabacterium sp. OR-4 TaxID=2978127 RepID=UPI0021B40C4C|nr:hypothetical protein [Aquabacterium sp. OR-4]MDT7837732.1 hypothetical protein [Aquabacterium sp. OR-4]